MQNNVNDEKTTSLLTLHVWGRKVLFGNLLKQGSINSLCWYTVDLGVTTPEVFVFDAQALAGKSFNFASDINTSVQQAQKLAEKRFKSFDTFAAWVRHNFYMLSN